MGRNMWKFMVVTAIGCFIATLAACGGGSDGGGSEGTNPLSVTFPSDLAITSPTAAGEASYSVSKPLSFGKEGPVPPENTGFVKPPEERRQEIQDVIFAGTREGCTISLDLFKTPMEADCYGPNINFENHPEGNDQSGSPDYKNGALPGGDIGIWAEYNFVDGASTGEACLAAKLNNLIGNVSFKVDTAVNLFAGMLCLANVDGVAVLPAIGETKDFTGVFDDGDISGLTITSATITRENDVGGNALYYSHIAASVTVEGNSSTMDINLKHMPTSADNTSYRGKIWYTMASDAGDLPVGGPANCAGLSNEEGAKQIASSVSYEKSAAGDVAYHVRGAAYCDSTADPFISTTNHTIDPSKMGMNQPGPAPSPNIKVLEDEQGWNGNFTMGTYRMSADGTVQASYAWQAGGGDKFTRTLIAELSGDEGAKSGYGYFGYGPAVDESGVGEITRFFCRWTGPGSGNYMGRADRSDYQLLAQKQCMTQGADKKFTSVSDDLHIRYAPDESCTVVAGQEAFIFQVDDKSAPPAGITNNDKREVGLWDVDLVVISGNVPAAPTPPTDIEE